MADAAPVTAPVATPVTPPAPPPPVQSPPGAAPTPPAAATPPAAPAAPPASPAAPAAPESVLGAAPPAPVAPPDYTTLKYQEGFQAPQGELATEMTKLFSENKLPAEQAQAFVDYGQKLVKQTVENTTKAVTNQINQTNQKVFNDTALKNQALLKADPVLLEGGQDIAPAIGKINGLLTKFGEPGLKEALWAAQDHPVLMRFLYKAAKALGEPGPVAPGTPPTPQKSASATLYGSRQ